MAGLGVFDGAESEEPASAASASDEDRQLASSTATAAVPSEVEETPEPASKVTWQPSAICSNDTETSWLLTCPNTQKTF